MQRNAVRGKYMIEVNLDTHSSRRTAVDVAIIGAGPAGSVAAALLRKAGRSVLVLERQHFPRFSIGESLLPQSMAYLEEAGMLQAVVEAGFQYKNGAHFVYRDQSSSFDFRDKHSPGWGTTYQVERAVFDDILIRCAARRGKAPTCASVTRCARCTPARRRSSMWSMKPIMRIRSKRVSCWTRAALAACCRAC